MATALTHAPLTIAADPIAEEQAARALAARLRLEFRDLRDFHLDAELFRAIPIDLMLRCCFVPIGRAEGVIEVVMADPSDITVADELELIAGAPVRAHVGLRSEIQ